VRNAHKILILNVIIQLKGSDLRLAVSDGVSSLITSYFTWPIYYIPFAENCRKVERNKSGLPDYGRVNVNKHLRRIDYS